LSYFTTRGDLVLDDWAARGKCASCHSDLDLDDGCYECDEMCFSCGKYLWKEEDTRRSEDLICNECWLEN
jgi:aminoglycoside phosphotransferase family enzyme